VKDGEGTGERGVAERADSTGASGRLLVGPRTKDLHEEDLEQARHHERRAPRARVVLAPEGLHRAREVGPRADVRRGEMERPGQQTLAPG
jgi:hypothetical protein